MSELRTIFFALALAIVLVSCDNRTETNAGQGKVVTHPVLSDTTSILLNESGVAVPNSIKRFVVDDYPVTDEMFGAEVDGNSSRERKSGQTMSFDKVWFRNDSLGQTLVFGLYTDYHRLMTYHFYDENIPLDMMSKMELHTEGGEPATEKQKQKDFSDFVRQAKTISSSYSITQKGLKLGDAQAKAINIYGKPDKRFLKDGIEKLEWKFVSDELYDGSSYLVGKPLAKDNFGHQVTMYFRNGRLIGQCLFNDAL